MWEVPGVPENMTALTPCLCKLSMIRACKIKFFEEVVICGFMAAQIQAGSDAPLGFQKFLLCCDNNLKSFNVLSLGDAESEALGDFKEVVRALLGLQGDYKARVDFRTGVAFLLHEQNRPSGWRKWKP